MASVTYYSGPFSLILRRTATGKDETPVRQRYSDPDGGPSVLVPGKEATAAEAMDFILLTTFDKKAGVEKPPWAQPGGKLYPEPKPTSKRTPFDIAMSEEARQKVKDIETQKKARVAQVKKESVEFQAKRKIPPLAEQKAKIQEAIRKGFSGEPPIKSTAVQQIKDVDLPKAKRQAKAQEIRKRRRLAGEPPKGISEKGKAFAEGLKSKPKPKIEARKRERVHQIQSAKAVVSRERKAERPKVVKPKGKISLASSFEFQDLAELGKEAIRIPFFGKKKPRLPREARETLAGPERERAEQAQRLAEKREQIEPRVREKVKERATKPPSRVKRVWGAFKAGLKGEEIPRATYPGVAGKITGKYPAAGERRLEEIFPEGATAKPTKAPRREERPVKTLKETEIPPTPEGKISPRPPGLGERAAAGAGKYVGGMGRLLGGIYKKKVEPRLEKTRLFGEKVPKGPDVPRGIVGERIPEELAGRPFAQGARLALTPARAIARPVAAAFGAGLRGVQRIAPVLKGEREMPLPKEMGAALRVKRKGGEARLVEPIGAPTKRLARRALGAVDVPMGAAQKGWEWMRGKVRGKPLPERKIEPALPRKERPLEKRVPKGMVPFVEEATRSQSAVARYHKMKPDDPRKKMALEGLGGEAGLKAHTQLTETLESIQAGERIPMETLKKRMQLMRGKEPLPTDVGVKRVREKTEKGWAQAEKGARKRVTPKEEVPAPPKEEPGVFRSEIPGEAPGAAPPRTAREQARAQRIGGRPDFGEELGRGIMGPQARLSGYYDPASHIVGEAPGLSPRAKSLVAGLGSEEKFLRMGPGGQRSKLEQIMNTQGVTPADKALIQEHSEKFFAPREQLYRQERIPGTPAPEGRYEVPAQHYQAVLKEAPEFAKKHFEPGAPGEVEGAPRTYFVTPSVYETMQKRLGDKLKAEPISGERVGYKLREAKAPEVPPTHLPGQEYKPDVIVPRTGAPPEQPVPGAQQPGVSGQVTTPSGQTADASVLADVLSGGYQGTPQYQQFLESQGVKQPGGLAGAMMGAGGFMIPYMMMESMAPGTLGGMGSFVGAQMAAPGMQNFMQSLFGYTGQPQLQALRRTYVQRMLAGKGGQGTAQAPAEGPAPTIQAPAARAQTGTPAYGV